MTNYYVGWQGHFVKENPDGMLKKSLSFNGCLSLHGSMRVRTCSDKMIALCVHVMVVTSTT